MGDLVSVHFGQTLRGDREKIVMTLLDISEMLQREVDARVERRSTMRAARRVDAEEITRVLARQLDRLTVILSTAPASFQKASSPKGKPEMLRRAYSALLDDLLTASESLAGIQPPNAFAGTDAAFRSFVSSFYRQIAAWPPRIRDAVACVSGNAFDIELTASVDIGPLVSAFAKETAAARL